MSGPVTVRPYDNMAQSLESLRKNYPTGETTDLGGLTPAASEYKTAGIQKRLWPDGQLSSRCTVEAVGSSEQAAPKNPWNTWNSYPRNAPKNVYDFYDD